MKIYAKFISAWLIAAFLLPLSACMGGETVDTEATEPPAQTEHSSEIETNGIEETPRREVYEDLSFQVPAYENSETKTCTVQTEGKGASGQVKLDFSATNGLYVISSTKIGFSCHDVATCADCGYVNTEAGGAYLMSSQGLDQGGITVTLATPLLASSVTGMTLTFKTTAEATSSSMRILPMEETNNAAFVNDCASMAGATTDWVTVDLGMKDFADIADSDGYIRGFQMYFRNKNKTDCYVQSVNFTINPDQFLLVDEAAGNCFYRQGATEAVAEIIAARFTSADIKAEITVTGASYRKNTTTTDGSLRYKATATMPDGTKVERQHTAVIPAITGAWLDTTDGPYGALHDSLGQWQETFDPSGLLFLTDNRLACTEGVDRIEYTVIEKNHRFDDEAITWLPPQSVEMNENGFSHMLVNAFLDMNDALVEGESYRLLVRGVTQRNNYILHVDIPFVYSPLSKGATEMLQAAGKAIADAAVVCTEPVEDKAAFVRDQLSALIHNESIAVDVSVLGEGVNSLRVRVALRCVAEISEARLPTYTLKGQRIMDVYNYEGRAFMFNDMTVPFTDEQNSLSLISPYDGEAHMVLAAECIYAHAQAPLAKIENANYGYMRGEYCTPLPVRLVWTDEKGAEGKQYTVLISTNRDMSLAQEITVTDTCVDVYHLNIGTQYFWQVRSADETSLVQTFTTEAGYPRFIKLDGVSNVRDLGGYITRDGRRVKQNLAYRSAQLESITDEGLAVALQQLNIRTDLDLRGSSIAPLGPTVQHISVSMQWYEHIFGEDKHEAVRKTVATFAYEENYPILFHCSMGRDRTGTTAFLILGLLGVDEDTLRHEYCASFFSQQGAFDEAEFPLLMINMNRLVDGFDDYGNADDTLQEKIEAFLLHIGVTEAEIQSIRDIWLES